MNHPTSNTTVSDFCGKILDFFENICSGLDPQDCLLGMSEILESLFGKLKTMVREDLKRGFTGSVLFVAACTGKIDQDEVKNAMTHVNDQDVKEWVQKNIGETSIQKRRRCLGLNRKKPGRKKKQEQISGKKEDTYNKTEIKLIGETEKKEVYVHKSVHEDAPTSMTDSHNVSENRGLSCSEDNLQSYECNPENMDQKFGKVESVWVIEQENPAHQNAHCTSSYYEANGQSYERNPENTNQKFGKAVWVVEQKSCVHQSADEDKQKWLIRVKQEKIAMVKWDKNKPELSEVFSRGIP